MRNFLISLGIFVVFVVLGVAFGFLANQKSEETGLLRLKIGNQELLVEIADEALEQSRGLSGRPNLPENQGMLFIFPDKAIRAFWMRGMNFPLDIIWIRDDEIIGFSENLPPAETANYPFYSSPEPVDKVLEINASLVKKLGLKIGDKVSLLDG